MADRRMLSLSIVDSDKFLDMSVNARLLYYDLVLRADDDGFVSSPKKIMRIVEAKNDDLQALIDNGYIIPQKDGIVVVRHWFVHNTIRSDRYKPTIYADVKNSLAVVNKVYYAKAENAPKACDEPYFKPNEFIKPTIDEIKRFCEREGYDVSLAESFYEICEKKKWSTAGIPMTEWETPFKMWYTRYRKENK